MAAVPLAAGSYIHWGVIQISVTNLVIILVMIAVFIAALLLPFPGGARSQAGAPSQQGPGGAQPGRHTAGDDDQR